MSKFFSFKLYRQGLKNSRLYGIAIVVIVTVITALVPLTGILSQHVYEPGYEPETTIVGYEEFAIPLLLILVLAPILTLSMFSFLNKRNESDFYHSIPFTRPCVYFSFLASVMTWLTATLILALSVNTVLWSMVPYTAVSLTMPLVHFLVYFLAVLLLTAFTVVAMTLTGTLISNLLIFVLLFASVRVAGALFVVCLENQFPIMVTELTPARFLQIDFNLPIALFIQSLDGDVGNVFANPSLWIYTAVISVGLIALGCVLYTKRRSEMAGQSAPNRILQHVYRCAITMPMAFAIATTIIADGFEPELLIVLVAITLLIYYLYELITTKRLKNLLFASAFLPVLIVGGVIFGVTVSLAGNAAVNYTPDADELESVSVYNSSSSWNLSYEEMNTQAIAINQPEVLEFVAKELKEMKNTVETSDAEHYLYPSDYLYEEKLDFYTGALSYYEKEENYCLWTLKITEKSGRVCGRTLCLTDKEYETLNALFTQTEEYENALLALPTESEILYIDANIYFENENAMDAVWESFVKEFNALPHEEQIAYKSLVTNGEWSQYALYVQGMKGVDRFYSVYLLDPARFPETCKLYVEIANQSADSNQWNMTVSAVKEQPLSYSRLSVNFDNEYYSIENHAEMIVDAIEFVQSCASAEGVNGQIVCINLEANFASDEYGYGYGERYFLLSEEDIAKLLGIMQVDGYVDKGVIPE